MLSGRWSAQLTQGQWLTVFLLGLVVLRLTIGVLYSVATPPWQAPDEPRHFEHAKLLADKRRPLTVADVEPALQRDILQSMMDSDFWRWHWLPRPETTPVSFKEVWPDHHTNLHRPSLYYLAAIPFLDLASGRSLEEQLWAVRQLSVLLGMLTVVVAFFTARTLFPKDSFIPVGTASFVALVPMYAYISSTVNNDNLATLAGSLFVLVIAMIFRYGLNWILAGALLATLAVGLGAKRTLLYEVAMVGALPMVYLWRRSERWVPTVIALTCVLWVLLVALGGIVAFAPGLVPAAVQPLVGLVLNNPRFALRLLDERYLSWEFVQLIWKYAEMTGQSFWARFGWMSLPVDDVWYDALKVVHLGAALGLGSLVFRAWRRRPTLEPWQWKGLLVLTLGIVVLVALAVAEAAYWFSPNRTPQGRYFFTLIVPIGLLFTLGWRELLPERWRVTGLITLVGFLLVFNLTCLFWYFTDWFGWAL